jgi:eukaryotic-like serine/threonine-protein kinase
MPMNLDPAEIIRLLPFAERYERRRQRRLDGPFGSWEAFDRVLERDVVLNIPWAYSHIPGFLKTARLAASLQHPSLLPVYDLGFEGPTPYFTTASVRGEPLSNLLRTFEGEAASTEKPLPLRPIVGAVRDACRALEYAHLRGLLQLHLHPDCLLVGEDYRIVLDVHDWESPSLPEGGEADPSPVFGFPFYLSPEQIAGQRSQLGPATDVFGLGGILHLILFGTPPNHRPGGTSAVEVIAAILDRRSEPRQPGTPRPVIRSSLARRSLDGLVAICLKALAYEPDRRYPTAAALAAALDGWLEPDRSSWWGPIRRRAGGV